MIERLIIPMLIVPMAAVVFAGWGVKIKAFIHPTLWHKVKMKPIDCAFCLSFWINVLFNSVTLPEQQWYMIVLFALASGVVAKKVEDIL